MPDLASLTLRAASRALRASTVSPVDLTSACLERIARLDPRLHAFITVTPDRALEDARRAEDEIGAGRWRGPLHGVPIALKDNIDTAGIRTTAASRVLADRIPERDATVARILAEAGAVLLGKLNMHEFALGTTSAISAAGPVRNPWALDRVAGGSSGGSGAAVAAGLCLGAVGTDTGGSIRIPASCCGIVGFKPTYGVVPADGVVPVSPSFDHVGPMCRTVDDAALMFRAMTRHPIAAECDPDLLPSIANATVGVLRPDVPACDSRADPEVVAVFEAAVNVLRGLVGSVRATEFPVPTLGGVIELELRDYHVPRIATMREAYDRRTVGEIENGAAAEQDRVRLASALANHRATAASAFHDVDLVVVPTLPTLPLRIDEAVAPFALDSCTFAFSLAGVPSISVPCGFSASGLPIGLSIAGPPLSEPRVLALALAYQQATKWHLRRPAGM